MKQTNNATADQAGVAESVEGRTPTKENTSQSTCPWHRTGYGRKQGLRGVRQVARECGLTPSFEVGAVCGNSARTDVRGAVSDGCPYRDPVLAALQHTSRSRPADWCAQFLDRRFGGGEESDGVVVPMKQMNNATEKQAEAAEFVEGRTPTKEDTG